MSTPTSMPTSIPTTPAGAMPGTPAGGPNPALAELADIQLPSQVGLWPPAIGWWVLVLATMALLIWLIRRAIQHNKFWRVRKLAVTQLTQSSPSLADTNNLLKRVARHYFPATPVASMQGEDWSAFLCQHHTKMDPSHIVTIINSSYQPVTDDAEVRARSQEFQQFAIKWLSSLDKKKLRDSSPC